MLRKVMPALLVAALLVPVAAAANVARVLESGDNEILVELATDDYSFDEVVVGGETFVRVDAPRYESTKEEGLPALPKKAVLVGIPFGAELRLEVVSLETENLGRVRVEPFPHEEIVAEDDFAIPVQRFAIDEAFYARGGTYPATVAELGAQGTLRHQRVARVVFHPFQYSPGSGTLTLHSRMVVRVVIERAGRQSGLIEARERDEEWERVYDRSVVNSKQAAKWRMRKEPRPASRAVVRQRDAAYRLKTVESGIHKLTYAELAAAGFGPTTSVDDVAVYERSFDEDTPDPFVETPVAIVVEDLDADGFFDDSDYLLFPAQSFEEQHMPVGYEDRWGRENAYWLAANGDLAARMATRPGWLDEPGLEPPVSFRDTVRFEQDIYFDSRPDDDFLDLYHWTKYQSNGDNYRLPFTLYDVLSGGEIRMRTRYQGMTSSVHTIEFRISYGDTADNYVGQWHFVGISENMEEDIFLSDPIPAWFFTDGAHELRTIGSNRGSGANLDWFEFQYDREFTAREERLSFTNAGETGLRQFEIDRLATDDARAFDVTDPFSAVRFSLAPENFSGSPGSFTLVLQDDVGGFTRYEAVEGNGYHTVVDIERRDPANLALNEADLIVVMHENFESSIEPLLSHREAEGWVVARALTEEVYDEFGGGIKSLEALRYYFNYAFDEWDRTPQFVMLVGDASEDTRGTEDGSQPDYIPTLLGHGSPSYPQLTASDQWFISSAEGPMYLPRMFIGRLSVGSTAETQNVVSKILGYESYGPNEAWRNDVFFLGDDQWRYGTPGGAYSWDWSEQRFTDICVQLAEMVDESPAGVDTTLFMLRRHTTPFHESNGVEPGSEPWSYFATQVLPFVLDDVTPELVDQLSDGAVIVNFQGHGNRTQMTHEQLFQGKIPVSGYNDINDLTNANKPFIFLGFSCHLSQFHSSNEGSSVESMVEQMLFRTGGNGAVAGYACAGAAYLSDNTELNEDIFEAFFLDETQAGSPSEYFWPRWALGSILAEGQVKFITADGYSQPNRTYLLIGDPLLHLDMSPPTIRVTLEGETILNGEYLEATEPDLVTFVVDVIDEVELDPAAILVEKTGLDPVPPDEYTIQAIGDTLGELGRWYRLTWQTVIESWPHDIKFSATDMNGQTRTFAAHVAEGSRITIRDVANHPNPFHHTTKFIYMLNQGGADVRIDIYTVGGRHILTIDDAPGDLNYNEVEWDGVDGDGDTVANGLYLYVIEARGEDGSKARSNVGRVVVARGPKFDR